MVKVSIIIPVYNVLQYISDCLDSVFCQNVDISSYEVIVVDDCSPYGEKEVIDTYLEKYPNIRYIRHDINKRQGGARNTGIRAAQGEYVMFLDSDDCLLYSNTLAILLEYVKKNSPTVLRSISYYHSFSNSKSYQQIKDKYLGNVSYNSLDFVQWRKSEFFGCFAWATLYKREFLIEKNLYFRESVMYEDTDWTQKVLYYAGNIDFIDFAYYAYRENPNSITRRPSVAAFDGNVDGVIATYRFFENIKFDKAFRIFLNESFVDNIILLLKISRNYPILVSYKVLKKIRNSGLMLLRSKSNMKNVILKLMHYLPLFPIVIVKMLVSIKRMFQR